MKQILALASISILVLAGCGGETSGATSVSGLIFDSDGNPVRSARVFIDSSGTRETLSTSSGSYRLENVPGVDISIKASIVKNGVTYTGENLARVFSSDPSASHNIVLVRVGDQASVRGTVFGTGGVRLQGARISARPTATSLYSSTQTITDGNGDFLLSGLAGGATYEVQASFPNFSASGAVRTLPVGTTTSLNFSLGGSSDPLLPKPVNLDIIAWTSPAEVTRSRETAEAISNVKSFIDRRYTKGAATRTSALGNAVEVQLYWDRIDNSQLLGYALYRRRGSDAWLDLDFLRDPLAETYLDSDVSLRENITWFYSISAANTRYPDTNNSESDFSDAIGVSPLGDMIDRGVNISGANVTFNWQALAGAANYTLYVFDEFPGIRVSSYANNFSNPVSGTSFAYNLRPLAPGQRYYYLILGANTDDSARSLSGIGSFIAP